MILLKTLIALIILTNTAVSFAGGYESVFWGSELSAISKKYPNGHKLKLGSGELYRQSQPTRQIVRRTFAFSSKGLHTVTVVFDSNYVKQKKLENITSEMTKRYGMAEIDRSNAPEKLSMHWVKDDTRITFGYYPRRSDMTVMLFQKITP